MGIKEARSGASRSPGVGGVASNGWLIPDAAAQPIRSGVFWIVGIVITILSGGVAIYARHHHLWD
jgi:hypothetical protein